MIQRKVKINSIEDVKNFVVATTALDLEVDLRLDRYAVDAKSVMGVFSLDLDKPIDLIIWVNEMDAQVMDYLTAIKRFIIE